EGGGGFIQPLLQLIDAARSVALGRAQRLLPVAAVHERFGIADLVAQAVVANRARRLRQLARGLTLLLRRVARRRIEIVFELAELALEIVLLLVDALRLLAPLLAVGREAVDAVGDLLLLARELLGALLRVLDVAVRAIAQRAFELALCFLQAIERLLRLRGGVGVAACRGAPHGVGRFAHLPRGVEELRPVLLTRETLEPARGLFRLLRQRTLLRAAARRR